MYLERVTIKNIKCFSNLKLDFRKGREAGEIRRWTALLGENGVGKSSVLQAIAATLAGPSAMRQLLPLPEQWVREGASHGELVAHLIRADEDAGPRGPQRSSPYMARYFVLGEDSEDLPAELSDRASGAVFDVWPSGNARTDFKLLRQTAYAEEKYGWLACGYGPFRRLSGGSETPNKITYSGRKAARFVTLFYESAALTNVEEWLTRLYNTARDGDERNKTRLEAVRQAFREELLPMPAEILVDATSARLKIAGHTPMGFDALSDGYRSMLALGIDLMRWLTAAFPESDDPMRASGVVLIDELDAHLHPKWQRDIGFWLLEKFPNLQFVVATHSPFLAQVAAEEGGNVLLKWGESGVTAQDDLETVSTWRADQILRTLFELDSVRSPEVQKKLKAYQKLHIVRTQRDFTAAEAVAYRELDEWVETLPSLADPQLRSFVQRLHHRVDQESARLQELV